jgi:hypothetical protein
MKKIKMKKTLNKFLLIDKIHEYTYGYDNELDLLLEKLIKHRGIQYANKFLKYSYGEYEKTQNIHILEFLIKILGGTKMDEDISYEIVKEGLNKGEEYPSILIDTWRVIHFHDNDRFISLMDIEWVNELMKRYKLL